MRPTVAFVAHHDFRSNSGIHLFNLANGLADIGTRCAAVVPGDLGTVDLLGQPRFDVVSGRQRRRVRPRLVHAWTPRTAVRTVAEPLARRSNAPSIVHLEDNESLITDAGDYKPFLAAAAGVTVVHQSLLEFAPPGKPTCVIWPAFEPNLFRPRAADPDVRARLGIADDAAVIVYHGNTHALNVNEVRNLYLAVALLNERGTRVTLVRLGDDWADVLGSKPTRLSANVVRVPYVPRADVPAYLALADVFVQPGAPGPFNDYRFPSKLPEFFAMGKPVILPRANVGLSLRDGEECLHLMTGDAEEIVAAVSRCLSDPVLCVRLGEAGRAFAEEHLSWSRNAQAVRALYDRVLDEVER